MTQDAPPPRLANILLVEDDDQDAVLIRKTLEGDRVLNSLERVCDGIEAMEYLRQEGAFNSAVRPDLILLDLNMPRMDGRQVLKECKEDPALRTIPIVVFTTSDSERDVVESYGHKANCYVTKPIDLVQFRDVLRAICGYWFCIVALPAVEEGAATA